MSDPLPDAKVLVVDDDDDVRAVAVAILRELGYDAAAITELRVEGVV